MIAVCGFSSIEPFQWYFMDSRKFIIFLKIFGMAWNDERIKIFSDPLKLE